MALNNSGNGNAIAGAITYPGNNDRNLVPVPVQPRQPSNLQGLLRFAMEATKVEDAPGPSQPMDEERRKFLEDALNSMTVNVAGIIKDAIKVLSDAERMNSIKLGDPLPDDVKNSFESLMEHIDNMDVANDFYKMGGFAVFPVCYGCENEEVRARASAVLGEVCQNNPYWQEKVLEYGLFPVLLNLAQTEQGEARTKCVYAISCATRGFAPAWGELEAHNGSEILVQLLSAPEPSTRTKAAFLVRYLCQHCGAAKDEFVKLNIVETVAEQMRTSRDESTSHLFGILMALVDGSDPIAVQQCRDPSLKLKEILEEQLKHPDMKDEAYSEEKEYYEEFLASVFNSCHIADPVDEVADR